MIIPLFFSGTAGLTYKVFILFYFLSELIQLKKRFWVFELGSAMLKQLHFDKRLILDRSALESFYDTQVILSGTL